jgi:hypothetical protein
VHEGFLFTGEEALMAKAGSRDGRSSGTKGANGKVGFAQGKSHAMLARFATSRWSRVVGYGVLIFACRVVRTIIRA